MLGTPSWVISISPAGSQSLFLGCPWSLPPLSHGGACPPGASPGQGQVPAGRFPALHAMGCQAWGPRVKELPGKQELPLPWLLPGDISMGQGMPISN